MVTYLAVPYSEKDKAKILGAKWDPSLKQWYTENNNKNLSLLLNEYSVNNEPVILVGEDREYGGNNLFVDLIPTSCWFTNVRSSIHQKDWDRVRKHIYQRVNFICECCNINTKELEAHERWNYDNITKVQKLKRLVALCHQCHQATHMGLAQIKNKEIEATNHLKKVRNFSENECNLHISNAFNTWKERNKYDWTLDITLITDNGIKIR
jgi:hypothetical protein